MAKKKEDLTLQEKLDNALVADWEQPYRVPDNWVWSTGSIIFQPTEAKKPIGEKFFYIDIDSIDNKSQCISQPKYLETIQAPSRANRGLKYGDTLFSLVRPYLKNIAYIDDQWKDCIASTGFYVCRPTIVIKARFLYWLMVSGYIVDGLNQFMKGDNSPSIRKNDIENFPLPLPPLAEQQRIVNRIESLFEKLDSAKELAQNALDTFENRKAAILHKAFTGELTKKWREENGVSFDSWEENIAKNVCGFITKGETPTKHISSAGDIPFLKVYNIRENNLDFEYNSSFIPTEIHENRMKRSKVLPNDVIMNIVGPPLQKVAIVPDTYKEWNINQAIAVFRPTKKIITQYLYFCLSWKETLKEILYDVRGVVGQSNISLEQCRNIPINLPTLPEQTEIVRILDSIFEKEAQAKELANVIEKISLMKKAILARAFRGELGTNDPEEESAKELLMSILEED